MGSPNVKLRMEGLVMLVNGPDKAPGWSDGCGSGLRIRVETRRSFSLCTLIEHRCACCRTPAVRFLAGLHPWNSVAGQGAFEARVRAWRTERAMCHCRCSQEVRRDEADVGAVNNLAHVPEGQLVVQRVLSQATNLPEGRPFGIPDTPRYKIQWGPRLVIHGDSDLLNPASKSFLEVGVVRH